MVNDNRGLFMKVYQELTILPNEEVQLYFLWSKVYQQIHLALVEAKDADNTTSIGVSFPQYEKNEKTNKFHLGSKLRLFASSHEELEALKLNKWLSRLSDYIHITRIREVPGNIEGYAVFRRLSEKGNPQRLARRRAKRHGVTYEEALAYYLSDDGKKHPEKNVSDYPFITLKSLSGGNNMTLIIAMENREQREISGRFSTYGLSSKSTVPVF